MTAALLYGDGVYAIEPFDRVEVALDGAVFEGEVTGIYARRGEARVRYRDHVHCRRDGEPRVRAARLAVAALEFCGRDG